MANASTWALMLTLTVVSGLFDAEGFLYASRIWQQGVFDLGALWRSAASFAVGISIYFVMLRSLDQLGVNAAEVQTLLWFGVTLVGVALLRGTFFAWPRVDQAVAVLVLAGIAALLVRNPA